MKCGTLVLSGVATLAMLTTGLAPVMAKSGAVPMSDLRLVEEHLKVTNTPSAAEAESNHGGHQGGHFGGHQGGHFGGHQGGHFGGHQGGHFGGHQGGHFGGHQGGHFGGHQGGHFGGHQGGHFGGHQGGHRDNAAVNLQGAVPGPQLATN